MNRNSRTFQGLLSQFKDVSRLYANSRTFQDKQSNSRAFQYCTNPVKGGKKGKERVNRALERGKRTGRERVRRRGRK